MDMNTTTHTADGRETVVCDIDGTLSLVAPAREAMLRDEHPDWDAFYEDPFDDEPKEKVCRLVRHLSRHYRIVFCTSRRDSVRGKTLRWLQRHLDIEAFPNGYALAMRRGSDPREDTVVKPEALATELLAGDSVLFVLEDSDAMIRRWSDLGLTCVKVA